MTLMAPCLLQGTEFFGQKTGTLTVLLARVYSLQGIVLCQFMPVHAEELFMKCYSMLAVLAQWRSNQLPLSPLYASYHEQSL
jgi:hypothetical protein